jgi:hypothetical protein
MKNQVKGQRSKVKAAIPPVSDPGPSGAGVGSRQVRLGIKRKVKPKNLHLEPFAFSLTFHPFTFDLWGSYADR